MCEWERLSFNTCKYNEIVYRTYFIYGFICFLPAAIHLFQTNSGNNVWNIFKVND